MAGLSENWDYDILSAHLSFDITHKAATATLRFKASFRSTAISLEVGNLRIRSVQQRATPLPYRVEGARLDVALSLNHPGEEEIRIDYAFDVAQEFQGLMSSGSTFIWPYFCGYLFPCKSDPAEGLTFQLNVTGALPQQKVVFPETITSSAPSYMLAWASGPYSYTALGSTGAGTKVGLWWLPGEEGAMVEGTRLLVRAFDWMERTIGPYAFGSAVASVSVPWRADSYGGMEHHPLWHIHQQVLADPLMHLHEMAHGWFGNGVRLQCWEDFVLAEGTVTYLVARLVGALEGQAAEDAVWAQYQNILHHASGLGTQIAWPSSCKRVDVLKELYSSIPYQKGAFFFWGRRAANRCPQAGSGVARFLSGTGWPCR
jgi:aminopeptidase N